MRGSQLRVHRRIRLDGPDIRDAVVAAGVQSAAGFNYRSAPAVEPARQLITDGRLGEIEHVGIRLLADYSAHPEGGLSWRFINEGAGSGILVIW